MGKVEQHKDEPVLLPNFIETLLKGYYDDSFVSVLYLQAINWHRSGVDATLSIAASSRLRMLFHNVGNNQSNALAGVMCKLVDLSQAVFAVVYHIADTLDHLRASADSEITRIRALTDSMSSAQPSPLGQAYIDHLSWKLHAYSLALGEREGVDELPLDSSDCHLGQWLAAGGFELIDPELRSGFVAAHDRLHEIAKQLLAFSVQQRPEQMIDHLLNIESASKEVTTVLALHLEREMRDLVTIDNLTRVGNRRGFDQGLSQKMEESARTGVGFGLIFIDIDYFKSINDRYGHTVGDEALQGAVERIKSALRSTDSEYRWGGEEFTVLVGTDSSRGVTQVAERIHAAVGDTPLLTSAGHISITLSLGCTYYAPHTTLSADELVIQADTAMLLAKEQGRNRIICHAEDGAD
ncbi:hypothetical protein BOW53_05800 [Solemya pervernicosa gill symbiont]|uniref:diguanylate cyclase n=1 Tax=Solemya pervernicosa gill symbiont TaxID=642797 RepID=A0A1T2L7K4_9GAMM|nr:hypothetical protein BOW53_05800 [Solemya pervernicosa gill symbiont]